MNSYFEVTFVLSVEVGGHDMMSIVPVNIDKTPIISLVSHNLLFCNHVPLSILILTLAKGKYFLSLFTS